MTTPHDTPEASPIAASVSSSPSATFADLFAESAKKRDLREGGDILVQVLEINENYVTVGTALKSDARIPTEEFHNNNELEIKVGDTVEVEIELLENGMGETILSRANARRKSIWRKIEDAMENDGTVEGIVQSRVRGGFFVALDGLRGFLPGSLADVFPSAVLDEALIGRTLQFKPIKVNRRRNSVVLSRRVVIERNMVNGKDPEALSKFEKGMKVNGRVRAIVDYGAFLEIGEGVFGLLHITDMSWKHTNVIADIMNVGDELEVMILRVDVERGRISLGRKQLQPDPWEYFERLHPVGSRAFGKVSKVLDYGIFVEIDGELQGLVHTSEMSWSRRAAPASGRMKIGDEVEVMILEIDKQRHRISLGMKQCKNNPWQEFATAYRKGDKLTCKVSSVSEYGIFMELPGEIEGLVRMADLSYEEKPEDAAQKYRKGQEVEVTVLGIDATRERIGLGIKQLGDHKFNAFAESHLKGATVQVKIVSIEEKGATVEVGDTDTRGFLPISEISEERVENVGAHLKVGEEHEALLIDIDNRQRRAIVSLKARDRKARENVIKENKGGKATTPLGALLKAKLQEAAPQAEAQAPAAEPAEDKAAGEQDKDEKGEKGE
jgi:small subunit ribosomal protein S1